MPLTSTQSHILRLLAAHRDPESDVAGSTPLNVNAPRYSADMAAAGRREPRDLVDLLTIHDRILPLGAVVWAAVGKSLGFTPEGLIAEVRRLGRYTAADFRDLASDPPTNPAATMVRIRQLLDEADAFVARMPTDKAGLLFLQNGQSRQPDPDRLDSYQTHAGQRRGHWPSSLDIAASMLERYKPNR